MYQKGRAAAVAAPAAGATAAAGAKKNELAEAGFTQDVMARLRAEYEKRQTAEAAEYPKRQANLQKKKKPKFFPCPYDDDPTSSQEEKDDMDVSPPGNVPLPPPPPLEGLRSPTEPLTYAKLEDMHSKIVQKFTPVIHGFGTLHIYEVTWVEHNLKEIKRGFKKDYERNT